MTSTNKRDMMDFIFLKKIWCRHVQQVASLTTRLQKVRMSILYGIQYTKVGEVNQHMQLKCKLTLMKFSRP